MSRQWEKRRLGVDGMDCAECALHVEEAVRGLPGLQEARVFLAAERLDVIYDPGLVDTAQIAQAVERAGYQLKEEAEDASGEGTTRLAERLAGLFMAIVTVVILVEMVGERLGLLDAALARIPPWLAVAAVLLGGYLIKGGRYLELLAKVDTLVMDKTGTLTFGRPAVTDVAALNGQREDQVLRLAAVAERFSEHPVAAAVRQAARERGIEPAAPETFKALAGLGVQAQMCSSCLVRQGFYGAKPVHYS